jgi:hypothetical protein
MDALGLLRVVDILLPSQACSVCPLASPQKNHLSGLQRKLLKLTFWNQEQLQQVNYLYRLLATCAAATSSSRQPFPRPLRGRFGAGPACWLSAQAL